MEDNRLISLLEETIDTEDPVADSEQQKTSDQDLLEKFKNLYSVQRRHSYNQITRFILEKYKAQGEAVDECLALARRIERLIDLADSKCLKQCQKLQCFKVDPPQFSCLDEDEVCSEYKSLARSLNKLHDHIMLEMMRYNEIQAENKRIIDDAKKLKMDLKRIAGERKEELVAAEESRIKISEELEKFNHTRTDLETKQIHITKQYEDMQLKYEEVLKKEEEIKLNSDKIEKQAYSIEDQTNQIYIQVVAIFGIFTAIVFAMFGGLTVINTIVQTMSSELGFLKACTLSLLIGIVIFNVLYGLLYAISKIIDRPIAFSAKGIKAEDWIWKRALKRHPLCFWVNLLFGVVLVILIGCYGIEWVFEVVISLTK